MEINYKKGITGKYFSLDEIKCNTPYWRLKDLQETNRDPNCFFVKIIDIVADEISMLGFYQGSTLPCVYLPNGDESFVKVPYDIVITIRLSCEEL